MTLIHGGRSISTDWVLASVRFILVAIVCLSTGIVLAGVVGAAGVADQGTGNPEAADTALDQDAADSAVGDVPDRLEGDVTAAPVVVDGQVVVGTDRGVYVVSDGSIDEFVATRPVEGIEHVGDGRIVTIVDDRQFANVLGIDIDAGERLWTASHDRRIYNRQLGTVESQVPAFDAVAIDDGSADVAVAAGTAVIGFDGETGEREWSHEHSHNVWQLATADGRVYASTQDGSVLALDAVSGERSFETELAAPFEHSDLGLGTAVRSVWDVASLTVDGERRIAATTEDGRVVQLDPADGTVLTETEVVSFEPGALDNYYHEQPNIGPPTGPGDAMFFNLELTVADGEEATGLVVTVNVDQNPTRRDYDEEIGKVVYVDARSGEQEWENVNVELKHTGSIVYSETVGGGSLLLPQPPVKNTINVRTIDLGDGTEGDPVEVRAIQGLQTHNRKGQGYLTVDGENLVLTSTNGDLAEVSTDGTVGWTVPTMQDTEVVSTDVTGDGQNDYLMVSRNNRRGASVQHRGFVLRSGVDGATRWSTMLGPGEFQDGGGYQFVRTVPDGSGEDVIALRRPVTHNRDRNEAPPTRLVSFDGDDGTPEELAAWPGFYPRTMDVIGDVTGDGTPNAILGDWNSVRIVDLDTGDVVWERVYERQGRGTQEWSLVDGRDFRFQAVGGDGAADRIVAVGTEGGRLYVLDPEPGAEPAFQVVHETQFDGQLVDQPRRIEDRTGDGYDEVALPVQGDEERSTRLFAPGEGRLLGEFAKPSRLSLAATDADFTGDGTPGTITFEDQADSETAPLSVYEGDDRIWRTTLERAWEVNDVGGSLAMPAAPAGDVTGDGTEELAIVKSSAESGVRVRIHTLPDGERVETIELEPWTDHDYRDPTPGLRVEQLSDRTGDGEPELGVVARTAGQPSTPVRFYVVDPSEREVLLSGDGLHTWFGDLQTGVGLVRPDAAITTADPDAGVNLAETDDSSTQELVWATSSDETAISTVYVNDELAALTDGTSTTIRLPKGEHRIELRSTGVDGITHHDTAVVTVDTGSSIHLVLYAATGLSVALLFSIGLLSGFVRKRRR